MALRAVVLLCTVALSCAVSIQNPHIHDSIEDQIAMESGPTQSVVAPPPHLAKSTVLPPTTRKPTTPEQQRNTRPTQKPDELFEIISTADNEADAELQPSTPPRRPSAPARPQFGFQQRRPQYPSFGRPSGLGWGQQADGGSWPQQPAYSGQQQQRWGQRPGLQVLQLPARYSFGGLNLASALGSFGGGARTVVLLQPIYMPVRVRAPADDDQALAADSSQKDLDKYVRDEAARRPVSLMDILQQPFFF